MHKTFRLTLVASLLAVLPSAASPGRTERPERQVLSDEALTRIVGGVGAAAVSVPFPQNFITSDPAVGDVKWNKPGNRCQYQCSAAGPADLGFNASANVFQLSGVGLPVPVLEVLSDGAVRASTSGAGAAFNGTFVRGDGVAFDWYSLSMRTRCVGGTKNNQFCSDDGFCQRDASGCPCTGSNCVSGSCRTCDQNNVCNTAGIADAPCVPGSVTRNAQTCYLLSECATGSDSFFCSSDPDHLPQNCKTNGATDAGSPGDPYNDGPMHSALARVKVGTSTVGTAERVYRVVQATGCTNPYGCTPDNCEGGVETFNPTCPLP